MTETSPLSETGASAANVQALLERASILYGADERTSQLADQVARRMSPMVEIRLFEDTTDFALAFSDGRGLVPVIYEGAREAVAAAMADGKAPSAALWSWKDRTKKLVSAIRRARQHVLLIEIKSFLRNAGASALDSGIEAHHLYKREMSNYKFKAYMYHLIAVEAVRRDFQASALDAELEATACISSGENEPDIGLDDIHTILQTLPSIEEQTLLIEQINHVQGQLETAENDNKSKTMEIDLLVQQVRLMQQELERAANFGMKDQTLVDELRAVIAEKNKKLHRLSQQKKGLEARPEHKIAQPLRKMWTRVRAYGKS